MDQQAIKEKPDNFVQMRWRPNVKAKYDFMFDKCLSEEQRKLVNANNQIIYHEATVGEWDKQFKAVIEQAQQKKKDGSLKKILFMQFFAGHGMSVNGE